MCRRTHLHGCCLIAFGFGAMVGHCLESWFLCSCAGVGLVILGLVVIRKK